MTTKRWPSLRMSKWSLLLSACCMMWLAGCAQVKDWMEHQFDTPDTVYFSHAGEKWKNTQSASEANVPHTEELRQEPVRKKKIKSKEIFRETIYFSNDSYEPSLKETEKIRVFASRVIDGQHTIKITGHTDSNHSHGYNQRLSANRAERVKQLLSNFGVSESEMHLTAKSFDEPAADNTTEDGRAMNRRVLLEVELTIDTSYENQQSQR